MPRLPKTSKARRGASREMWCKLWPDVVQVVARCGGQMWCELWPDVVQVVARCGENRGGCGENRGMVW